MKKEKIWVGIVPSLKDDTKRKIKTINEFTIYLLIFAMAITMLALSAEAWKYISDINAIYISGETNPNFKWLVIAVALNAIVIISLAGVIYFRKKNKNLYKLTILMIIIVLISFFLLYKPMIEMSYFNRLAEDGLLKLSFKGPVHNSDESWHYYNLGKHSLITIVSTGIPYLLLITFNGMMWNGIHPNK